MQPFRPIPPPPQEPESPWNSLERTKIGLDIAKTLVTAILSLVVFQASQKFTGDSQVQALTLAKTNRRQDSLNTVHERINTRIAEQYGQVFKKRVQLWDSMALNLNDIYCYFLYVGSWKELSAKDIIARKRHTDRIIYSYRPFFSNEFLDQYDHFINSCYKHYNVIHLDAGLRTYPDMRPLDKTVAVKEFTYEDNGQQIHDNYFKLLALAATELNLPPTDVPDKPKTPIGLQPAHM